MPPIICILGRAKSGDGQYCQRPHRSAVACVRDTFQLQKAKSWRKINSGDICKKEKKKKENKV
jgi:hypothetical protein